jgi:trans-aconitate methyltransferase
MAATAHHSRQEWTPASYDTHARFVSDLAGGVIDWLAPKAGETILDLGCGDGVLTVELASRGARVVGVDSSAELLAAARGRGLDVRLMDGQQLAFDGGFDAVFSNAALHWMPDAVAVASGVKRALNQGGRFVAEFGGHGNVAAIVTAMLAVAKARDGDARLAAPWYFPSPESYRAVLENAGFTVKRIVLIPRPTHLPTGMAEWLRLFRQPFFEQFEHEAEAALGEALELLRPTLCDEAGRWTADYVRLRVEAVA